MSEAAEAEAASIVGPFLGRALSDGYAKITSSGRKTTILYRAANRTARLDDPEEKVRADFWAELIYRYDYPPERIGIEIAVPDRLPADRADIVIFQDDARTRPFAVVECKKDGISEDELDQAVEQAVGNGTWSKLRASYIGVVAGMTRRFFDLSDRYGVLERERNIVADLPTLYGKPTEYKYTKGGRVDIRPVSRDELLTTLSKCHQTLWGGGRLSPPAAFGELCKLIFVKLHDETTLRSVGDAYDFQLRSHETARQLSDRIRSLYSKQTEREPEVFSDPIRVDDATLRALVSHLEPINLNATDLDVKGFAFERFMDGFFKGDFGQYFTPREVIQLAVDLIEPTEEDVVIDPACGSAGFLLYTLDRVRDSLGHRTNTDVEWYQYWSRFAQKNLYGIEINDELTRVAKMNMIIHGDGHTNIVNDDSLKTLRSLQEWNSGLLPRRFDVVLTNPPFGASVSSTSQVDLNTWELGRSTSGGARRTQKTEILFIERVWELLKPRTGRAAIVLPDGILSNAQTSYVRDFIFQKFQVLAVVSLPGTAFSHYGAAVKSSVVALRRLGDDEPKPTDEHVFMAAPELIGYDATGRQTESQLPEVVEAYRRFKVNPTPYLVT